MSMLSSDLGNFVSANPNAVSTIATLDGELYTNAIVLSAFIDGILIHTGDINERQYLPLTGITSISVSGPIPE